MKILHICPKSVISKGDSYQEQLLAKWHRRLGHDVSIITNIYSYDANGKIIENIMGTKFNEDGVKIIRLKSILGFSLYNKLFVLKGLKQAIKEEHPDLIFQHGFQFLDSIVISSYCSEKGIKYIVDNHADYSNSCNSFLSKYVLHAIIWKWIAKKIAPTVSTFYGVMPSRVKILSDLYGIDKRKCKLLMLGVDDDLIENNKGNQICKDGEIRMITGGKIDRSKKETLALMDIVAKSKSKISLTIFGSVDKELSSEFMSKIDGKRIKFVGWLNQKEITREIMNSDIACFPGRHSVLWEQTIGVGKPLIVKKWYDMEHLDIGGNVIMIDEGEGVLEKAINSLTVKTIRQMAINANSDKKNNFRYSRIALDSLR